MKCLFLLIIFFIFTTFISGELVNFFDLKFNKQFKDDTDVHTSSTIDDLNINRKWQPHHRTFDLSHLMKRDNSFRFSHVKSHDHFDTFNNKQNDNEYCDTISTNSYQPLPLASGSKPVRSITLYPWMAAIGMKKDYSNEIEWVCGGSLISNKIILTAAHCLQKQITMVRLGELDFSANDDNANPTDIQIESKQLFPAYTASSLYNDIGLIVLTKAPEINAFIKPICLPGVPQRDSQDEHVGEHVFVTGWGQLENGGKRSNVLRKIRLEIYNSSYCNEQFTSNKIDNHNLRDGIISSQICAGDSYGNQSICEGDSGGPLILLKNNQYFIIGVVSSGIGCGFKQFPGVFTRVSSFLPWIKDIINEYS